MPNKRQSGDVPGEDAGKPSHPRFLSRAADAFILGAAAFDALAALTMATVLLGLITVSVMHISAAIGAAGISEHVLLDAVSSLVISVAILVVAKYVMEEVVVRRRELQRPHEAREAVTKFMVIIALVVSIEGIVPVFELGSAEPGLLLYPIMFLCASVIIVVGLSVFKRLSLESEWHLKRRGESATADE